MRNLKAIRDAGRAASTLLFVGLAMLPGTAGSDDPAQKALQQQLLQRQQQQDQLQLRMRQQQRNLQSPPVDTRQQQTLQQLEVNQRERQQELHYRQSIEPPTAQPSDDEGTHRAKAEMERQRAQEQGQQQLQRFDSELQQQKEKKSALSGEQ